MKIKSVISILLASTGVFASTLLNETFDTLTPGALGTQNDWSSTGFADVQSSEFVEGQALEIKDGEVSHQLSSDETAIWLHFNARISAAPAENPQVTNANTSVAFFVNTNRNLVVFSNQTEVILSEQMPINTWTRFDIYCDYSELTWDLSVNSNNVAAGLPLYSSNKQIESVLIANNSSDSVFVDNIDIADEEQALEAPDSNDDGIPDWWQQRHMGGVSAGNANALAANGLTYRQSYIAKLNPANADDKFKAAKLTGRRGLSWAAYPGRQYVIEWASNLTAGFVPLETNIADANGTMAFEDTSSNTNYPAGFYRVRAMME